VKEENNLEMWGSTQEMLENIHGVGVVVHPGWMARNVERMGNTMSCSQLYHNWRVMLGSTKVMQESTGSAYWTRVIVRGDLGCSGKRASKKARLGNKLVMLENMQSGKQGNRQETQVNRQETQVNIQETRGNRLGMQVNMQEKPVNRLATLGNKREMRVSMQEMQGNRLEMQVSTQEKLESMLERRAKKLVRLESKQGMQGSKLVKQGSTPLMKHAASMLGW
jgi:hypothetical protein